MLPVKYLQMMYDIIGGMVCVVCGVCVVWCGVVWCGVVWCVWCVLCGVVCVCVCVVCGVLPWCIFRVCCAGVDVVARAA